jgi:hypothetical protein
MNNRSFPLSAILTVTTGQLNHAPLSERLAHKMAFEYGCDLNALFNHTTTHRADGRGTARGCGGIASLPHPSEPTSESPTAAREAAPQ